MTTNVEIAKSLQRAIDSAEAKLGEASSGSEKQATLGATAATANHAVRVQEGILRGKEKQLDTILNQLNPPPTKDVSKGGKSGGTKTIVDQDEVNRLNREKNELLQQIQVAKNEVETARGIATTEALKALEAATNSKELAKELVAFLGKVSNLKQQIRGGGALDKAQLDSLIQEFEDFSKMPDVKRDMAGTVSKAFFIPFKQEMEGIQKLLGNPVPTQEEIDAPIVTPEGTVDYELEQLGINGAQKEKIINFIEAKGTLVDKHSDGQTVNREEVQALYDDYEDIKGDLTDTQANSTFFVDLSNNVREIIAGSDYPDIDPNYVVPEANTSNNDGGDGTGDGTDDQPEFVDINQNGIDDNEEGIKKAQNDAAVAAIRGN